MARFAMHICAVAMTVIIASMGLIQQVTSVGLADAPAIKRIPLQRFDVPGTNYETVIGIAEIAPNVTIGRHTHPGPESGYVISGGFTLLMDGQTSRELRSGDSYKVPPRVIHNATAGSQGATVIATYVVIKGDPLASPAE